MEFTLKVNQVNQLFRSGFWMQQVQVLHGVSLEVPRHSIFGFLGANGAGKTTLIHLIVGLRRPSSGTVLVGGDEAHTEAARSKIGYLPERPYFHEHLTGEQLMKYFGALSGMSHKKVQSRIGDVLAAVGMSHARKLELKKYSKGMLQRIGIAQALLHDPEFLVLDEPMSGLDPLGRKEIRELIVRLAAEGRTVFFSSHVIPDVEAICDQVALIQKGRLLGCGPIGKFLTQGKEETEIVFSGLNLTDAKKIVNFVSIRESSDGIRATVKSDDGVNPVLEKLLKAKAQIQWVSPVRPSLESLFEEEKRK